MENKELNSSFDLTAAHAEHKKEMVGKLLEEKRNTVENSRNANRKENRGRTGGT